MAKHQRLIIFVVIGALFVSIMSSAILLIANGGDNINNTTAEELTPEEAAQLQAREEAEEFQRQLLEERQAEIAKCTSDFTVDKPKPIDPPEFDLPTGDITELKTIDIKEGTGPVLEAGGCVVAYYHGVLASDGTVFDSAYERGEPATFSLLQLIDGWQQGLPGMKEGGIRVLHLPSELAYGPAGSEPLIGPNEDLVFVVEIVEVVEI